MTGEKKATIQGRGGIGDQAPAPQNLKRTRRLANRADLRKMYLDKFHNLLKMEKSLHQMVRNDRRRLEGRAIQEVQISKAESVIIKRGRKFFMPCHSVPGCGLIVFHKIPPDLRMQLEHDIEIILEHETIHIVLGILREYEAIANWDRISACACGVRRSRERSRVKREGISCRLVLR